MVKLCTIDSSTRKTGIAIFVDNEYQDRFLIDCSSIKDSNERVKDMGIRIIKVLDSIKPDLIYIEHPQGYGRNVSTVFKLTLIIGVVFGWCLQNDCEFNEIYPSEWRKMAGFSQGNKMTRDDLKALSITLAKEKFGIDCGDDEADAISMGYGVIQNKGLKGD